MAHKSPDICRQKKLNQLCAGFPFPGCSLRVYKTELTLCTLESSAPEQMPANVRTKVRNFSELNYTDWCQVCAIPRSSVSQPIRGLISFNRPIRRRLLIRELGGRDQDQVPEHESETEKVWQTVFTAWTVTNWIFMKFTQMKSSIRF